MKFAQKLRALKKKQTLALRASVKPLNAAFHGPKMRVYAAKLKKDKEEKLKKEKERKLKLRKERAEKLKKEKS